jgi:uncharacterized membrane protein
VYIKKKGKLRIVFEREYLIFLCEMSKKGRKYFFLQKEILPIILIRMYFFIVIPMLPHAEANTSKTSLMKWGIFLGVVVVLCLAYFSYNGIIENDERIKSMDSQISNMYSRQSEILPKLTSVVNAAAKYEASTLGGVTALR